MISHNTDQQMLKKVVIMAFGSFSLHSIFEQKFGSIPQQKSHFSTSVLLDVCALNVDDSQMWFLCYIMLIFPNKVKDELGF